MSLEYSAPSGDVIVTGITGTVPASVVIPMHPNPNSTVVGIGDTAFQSRGLLPR